jgi:hypothetical protein
MSNFNGTVWSGWSEVPGRGTTDVALAATTLGPRVVIFEKGVADSKVYANSFDGSAWSGWYEVPGNGTTNVALGAAAKSSVSIFAKGIGDKKVYVSTFTP